MRVYVVGCSLAGNLPHSKRRRRRCLRNVLCGSAPFTLLSLSLSLHLPVSVSPTQFMAAGERETAAFADVGLSCLVGRRARAREMRPFLQRASRAAAVASMQNPATQPNQLQLQLELSTLFASPHDSFFAAR